MIAVLRTILEEGYKDLPFSICPCQLLSRPRSRKTWTKVKERRFGGDDVYIPKVKERAGSAVAMSCERCVDDIYLGCPSRIFTINR